MDDNMKPLFGKKQPAKCETHGDYVSIHVLKTWSGCPKCSGDRVKDEYREEQERRASEARDDAAKAYLKKLGMAGIPLRFQDKSLETYEAATEAHNVALRFALDYARNFEQKLAKGTSALFIGRPGTGKTHLACGIGQYVMGILGRSVIFSTVMRAVRRVKETWNRNSTETESEVIEAFVAPDLLILDEVGVQFGSEAERLVLFDIINERYERRKPTILLSNLSPDDVKACIGERIYDRLREGDGDIVVFDWESARGRL